MVSPRGLWSCLLGLVVAAAVGTEAARNCTVGVDLATPSSVSAFQCMAANGIQHATIRAFQSNCWLDPHAPQTIKNAWEGGLVVDVYIFPSVGCNLSPKQQVEKTLSYLADNKAEFNTLWIDVEDWGWGAEADCVANQDAIRPMMQAAISALGVERVGIYSMQTMWKRIMCDTTEWADTLFWWAHWDGKQTFDDFVPFGGWTEPFSKQWQDWGPGCLVDVDMDWRGSGSCGYSAEDVAQLRLEQAAPTSQSEPDLAPVARVLPPVPAIRPPGARADANCTIGVDLATPVSKSAFQCMIQERGVQFLTVRAFQSNCYLDPRTVDTIHAAWDAGVSGVDIYFFPSYGCSMSAIAQFDSTMEHLSAGGATFNRIFFDVEDWEWDAGTEAGCAANLAWLEPLLRHAQNTLGVDRVGIYSGKNPWQRITCGSTLFGETMLWYASWDKKPNYDNFVAFGGWTAPTEKQFTGNDFACDIHLDFDYRASGKC